MKKQTIIFDGECNLCNGVVGWLLQYAPENMYQFVPFQSNFGQNLLMKYNFPTDLLDTVILINENSIKTHSDGFLDIISQISGYILFLF